MDGKTTVESLEMECAEEKRRAHLLVEWTEDGGVVKLTGVQCDNPRLQSLDNWQCHWSCWQKVEKLASEPVAD